MYYIRLLDDKTGKAKIALALLVLAVFSIFSLAAMGFYNHSTEPTITKATAEPYKVVPGNLMLISAEIESDYPLLNVTADMVGTETITNIMKKDERVLL